MLLVIVILVGVDVEHNFMFVKKPREILLRRVIGMSRVEEEEA